MGGLYKELPEGLDEVDVVIVGGSWIQSSVLSFTLSK